MSRIVNLESNRLHVIFRRDGALGDLQNWLNTQTPVIAAVQASQLHYWKQQTFQHAVVVVGIENTTVHLLDPGIEQAPTAVEVDEFFLAWYELENRYAVISR